MTSPNGLRLGLSDLPETGLAALARVWAASELAGEPAVRAEVSLGEGMSNPFRVASRRSKFDCSRSKKGGVPSLADLALL